MQVSPSELEPFLSHRSFVRRLAASLLSNPADVDEVEQQTWISALGSAGEGIRDAKHWLASVVRHHAYNLTRGGARLRRREQAAARAEALASESDVVDRLESARALVAHVMELADPNREALLLRYYEDLGVTEIARRLGVPRNVVKGRLQRGLAELRTRLQGNGESGEAQWRRDLSALLAAHPVASVAGSSWLWLSAGALVASLIVIPFLGGTQPLEVSGDSLWPSTPSLTESAPPSSTSLATTPNAPAALSKSEDRQSIESVGVKASEVILRIGDAFVFGHKEASADGDRSQFDLYVQDIHGGVSLATLAGGAVPAATLTSLGLPRDAEKIFELVHDAPTELELEDLRLTRQGNVERTGLGFARSRSGEVYKLCLLELDDHREALKRSVRIAYEAVPSRKGGGAVQLPEVAGQPDAAVLAMIRAAVLLGASIPGDTFADQLSGDFEAVKALPDDIALLEERYLSVADPIRAEIAVEKRGAVFAEGGIGSSGTVRMESYGAVGVRGSMDGRIAINSYSYVYVSGVMSGTIDVDSYATIVLASGMSGTLAIRSYAKVLVRGPWTGRLDARSGAWSDLYLDGTYTESRLAEMSEGQDCGAITLFARSADLAPGEYKNIGTWRKVIVGGEVWNQLKF